MGGESGDGNPLDMFGISQDFAEEPAGTEADQQPGNLHATDPILDDDPNLEDPFVQQTPETTEAPAEPDHGFSPADDADYNETANDEAAAAGAGFSPELSNLAIGSAESHGDSDSGEAEMLQQAESAIDAEAAMPAAGDHGEENLSGPAANDDSQTDSATGTGAAGEQASTPMESVLPVADSDAKWNEQPGAQFFSLVCRNSNPDMMESLIALLQAAKLDLDIEQLQSQAKIGDIKITRVSEYVAALIASQCHQLGIAVEVFIPEIHEDIEVRRLDPPESEQSTGGFALQFPSNPHEMLVVTTDSIAGYDLIGSKGIVTAHHSIGRQFLQQIDQQQFLSEELRRLKNEPKEKNIQPKTEIERVFHQLFWNLQNAAIRLGANAVLGVRMATYAETQHFDQDIDQIRIILSGTAAQLQANTN